jgi:hypothetical protein
MKKCKWYRFHFEDGWFCICRGMSKQEIMHEELRHGKFLYKSFDCEA